MNSIEVRNSCIIIHGYTMGECERLENIFKVFDPVTHKFYTVGCFYDAQNRDFYIPSGMQLWKIKHYLGYNADYVRTMHHSYISTKDIKIKYPPRDEEQLKALKFMCDIDEFSNLDNVPARHVNLMTGKGKTYCSIACISFFRIKSIIITGSNTLLNQWKDEFLHYTNLESSDIIQLSGSGMVNMVLNGTSKKAMNASIILCTHGTLRSFGETYGWNRVYELFEKLGIGIKIFDEAHTNFDNTLMIDFYTNVWRTYYVTATPGRSNFRENAIYNIAFTETPKIDLFDPEKDPHTQYVAIKWNSRPNALQISQCNNSKYGLDRMKYVDYLTKDFDFYKMMYIVMDLTQTAIKEGGRVLMYIGTNNGILRVYKWIVDNYPQYYGRIGIFTSLIESKEDKLKEKASDKVILLSTTKSAGLGEHIEGLKLTIVLAEPFKSEIIARQTLGRTRDKDTTYIDMVDLGFKYTRKYYYEKIPVFETYATKVSDMLIDDQQLERKYQRIKNDLFDWRRQAVHFTDPRFEFEDIPYSPEDKNTGGPREAVHFFEKKEF